MSRRSGPRGLLSVRDIIGTATILVSVLAAIIAFIWPWRLTQGVSGGDIERYAPMEDGDDRLIERTNAAGEPSWDILNTRRIPSLRVASSLRKLPSEAIVDFYG